MEVWTLEELLEKLLRCPGVLGAFIFGKDGLVISTVGTFASEPDVIAPSAAEVLTNVENSFSTCQPLSYFETAGSEALVHIAVINEVTYLYASADQQVVVGRLRAEVRQVVQALREIL